MWPQDRLRPTGDGDRRNGKMANPEINHWERMAEKPDREEDDKWVQLIGLEPKDKDKDKEIQTQIQLGTFHRHAKTGKSTGSCFAAGTLVNQLSTSAAWSKIKKTISTIIFLEPGASLFHFI